MQQHNTAGVALITGASAGIGAVYADRLARRGHDLILVARDRQRLDVVAERVQQETGRKVEPLVADLLRQVDLQRVQERLRSDAAMTMLVNNAGIAAGGNMLGADLDRLEAMVRLNAIVPMRLAGTAAPGFVARGHGTLINIASVLALAPELFNGTYSGTKAFVLNLSLSLHKELQPHGVRVQAVLPGGTRTEIWAKSGVDIDSLPQERLMETGEMVDAALAGLDQGELVTIPSLPDAADWERFDAARLALGPNLSRDHAAARYRSTTHTIPRRNGPPIGQSDHLGQF
jgi:short-subunit dehydrogenase